MHFEFESTTLGYLNCWDLCVKFSRQVFYEAGWSDDDFDTYFNEVKRLGVFMYGDNHPNSLAIAIMAKLIARKIDPSIQFENIVIPDALTNEIWPLYPEIGLSIGSAGHYSWRMFCDEYNSVVDYLIFAYNMYIKQNLSPGDIFVVGNVCHDSDFNDAEISFLKHELTI